MQDYPHGFGGKVQGPALLSPQPGSAPPTPGAEMPLRGTWWSPGAVMRQPSSFEEGAE